MTESYAYGLSREEFLNVSRILFDQLKESDDVVVVDGDSAVSSSVQPDGPSSAVSDASAAVGGAPPTTRSYADLLFEGFNLTSSEVGRRIGETYETYEQRFDFLGIVVFVVCGHFILHYILSVFSCCFDCLVNPAKPIRSLKFLYLLFSNLVLFSCLSISFGALEADDIGYLTADLFLAGGALAAVESVIVYFKIIEFGQIIRGGHVGGLSVGSGSDAFTEVVVVNSTSADDDEITSDLPPSYDDVMRGAVETKRAKSSEEEEGHRQQQEGAGGGGGSLRMQPSLTSASILR